MNERTELGHWEADQIIGARNRSSLLTLTERVTRYAIGVTMPEGYSAHAMVAGLTDGLDRIPAHLLRSVTFDQGSEWANWAVVAGHYGIDTWFCDPHSPWQTRPDREPEPHLALVVPPRHRPRRPRAHPGQRSRRHHQQPATTPPRLPQPRQPLRCRQHRALTARTGRPDGQRNAFGSQANSMHPTRSAILVWQTHTGYTNGRVERLQLADQEDRLNASPPRSARSPATGSASGSPAAGATGPSSAGHPAETPGAPRPCQ